ncbi:MAG: glycosyltransferase [Pirellulaceae bacterium]
MVIPNGVELSKLALNFDEHEQRQMKISLGLDPNKLCVGTVGSLKSVKNHQMLLEAARILQSGREDLQFAIAGDGPLRNSLEETAASLRFPGDFHFLGLRNDVARVLQAFDIFSMHSSSEDFSVAILEAMCARLPVIATDVGGNAEIVDDCRTGLLIPSGDSHSLALCIARLGGDATLRQRMGQGGFMRIEQHFTSAAATKRIEMLYIDCVRRKAPSLIQNNVTAATKRNSSRA